MDGEGFMTTALNVDFVREQFPPLKDGWVFLENAGGSYVPRQVIQRVTEYMTEALLALTNNRYVILLLINVLLLVIGCFLEPVASISILVPVLMPVIVKVGIDPVHFGVVMTLNLMIGLLHPPLGMVLFVLSRIAKLSIERTTMAILPWLIPLLLSLIAITMIPELTLWLPRAAGMIK